MKRRRYESLLNDLVAKHRIQDNSHRRGLKRGEVRQLKKLKSKTITIAVQTSLNNKDLKREVETKLECEGTVEIDRVMIDVTESR